MKRIFLATCIVLFSGAVLFAEGTPEAGPLAKAEPVSITGTVTLADNSWPTITDGTKTYALLYPRYAAAGVPVKSGDTITVTGYVVPGPRWSDGKTPFLRIVQAEIKGKTYILPGAGMGAYGGFHNDDCGFGRGHGRGGMMGPGMHW